MSERPDYLWDPAVEADPEIVQLERALQSFRFRATESSALNLSPRRRGQGSRWMLAAAVALLTAGSVTWWQVSRNDPWTVETIAGLPHVTPGAGIGDRVGAGGQVDTDALSTARIAVGNVGVADVAPRSSLKILRTDEGEHRLFLSYGTIHATIWAKPRFFVVETIAATAVDLGCVYTLTTDSTGTGIVGVSVGEVQLESGGRTTLVAAGTAARVYPARLGLPYPLIASHAFRDAARRADSVIADADFNVLVREATAQGTITLWHLLPRATVTQRGQIHDRIAALVPPPGGITRDAIVALDAHAMASWLAVLRPRWSSEPRSLIRRFLVRIGLVKPVVQMELRRAIANPS